MRPICLVFAVCGLTSTALCGGLVPLAYIGLVALSVAVGWLACEAARP